MFKKLSIKPIQLTLISALATGILANYINAENKRKYCKGNFLRNVISKALPGAICVICSVIGVSILGHFVYISLMNIQQCVQFLPVNALMVLIQYVCQ